MNNENQPDFLNPSYETEVRTADRASVDYAVGLLLQGEPVAMPTETVYGLAADALNQEAVLKIFHAKKRPYNDPLIVHVAGNDSRWSIDPLDCLSKRDLVNLDHFDTCAQNRVRELVRVFWPGPLTLVLPRGKAIPDCVTADLPTVAIRMPRHPVAKMLITMTGKPLAAPSANRFGRISPTSAQDVVAELSGRIRLILDGGPCEVGLESTVLSVSAEGNLNLLRPGAVSVMAIARALQLPDNVIQENRLAPPPDTAPMSPGMSDSHYAPGKPFHILPAPVAELLDADTAWLKTVCPEDTKRLGLLVFFGDAEAAGRRFAQLTGKAVQAVALSQTANAEEAARALFREMRRLDDQSTAQVLFAEPCRVDDPLAPAIRDRLGRAVTR
ncbi:MAG: threonylcarbamoyl-AMP synthase [Myxococcales bacterium]|nr:threonylcarbamoyl-AMP synthase [Myxococcales bacterium]